MLLTTWELGLEDSSGQEIQGEAKGLSIEGAIACRLGTDSKPSPVISGEWLPEATTYTVTFDEATAESYPYIAVTLYWVFR